MTVIIIGFLYKLWLTEGVIGDMIYAPAQINNNDFPPV